MSRTAPSFAIVGAGALASALAPAWVARGARLRAVVAARRASAERLAQLCGADASAVRDDVRDIARNCELVLLAVPDARVELVAREVAAGGPFDAAQLFAHASGVLSVRSLAPLQSRGALVAGMHPLIALPPSGASPVEWSEVHFGIEGEERAVSLARAWVARLGARAFAVRSEAKALYHAAAVLASNDLVALLASAQRCLELAAPGAGTEALLALAESALAALRAQGGDATRALSGPLVRGDVATVRAHLAAFEELGAAHPLEAARLRELYTELLRAALPIASAARGEAEVADGALRALERELEEPMA